MNATKLFTRSLELMWQHKFLWLFGLVMALTGGAAGGNGSPNWSFQGNRFQSPLVDGRIEPVVLGIAGLVVLLLLIVWLVLFFYFRFVSRGALVCAVRDIEAEGSPTLGGAWHEGRAFYGRLLGLGLVVNVPLVLATLVVFGIAFLPLIGLVTSLVRSGGQPPDGWFAGIGLVSVAGLCCAGLFVLVLTVVIHPLYELAVRAIVLEDLRVGEGIRRGLEQARENASGVLGVYLLLIGARLGWGLVTAILWLPLGLFFFFLVTGIVSINLNALILIGLLLAIPLWLLFGAVDGLFQTFEANVWTEAYLGLLYRPTPTEPSQPAL